MSYTFKQNLVSSSKYSIKCPYSMTPKYVVVHNTANDASAVNEVAYMISNSNQVSYHIACDDVNVVQGLPLNRNAWHAGDGASGQGNRYGIGVEICYSKSGGTKYTQGEENAVYVCARLLYQFGLGIDALKQHHDFALNGKNCPHRIRDEGRWEGFKGRVQWVLGEIKAGRCASSLSSGTTSVTTTTTSTTTTTTTSTSSSSSSFKVGTYNGYVITTDSLNVRSQRNGGSTLLTTIPKGTKVYVGYIMYQDNSTTPKGALWGGVTYNGKTGFINLNYVQPTSAPVVNTSFKVKINTAVLNVRKEASASSAIVTQVKSGEVYTIVKEVNGWGLLKSGVGYINLSYTVKM